MKKVNIIKTFTFWFVVVAIVGVILNLTGIDDIGLFIGFNPLLNFFSSTKSARDAINAVPYLWVEGEDEEAAAAKIEEFMKSNM